MFKLKRKNVILGVILICILIASYFLYNYFKIKEEQLSETREEDDEDADTMVQEKTQEKTQEKPLNHSSILPFQSISSVGPSMAGESISLLGPDDNAETFDTIKPYPF